MALVGKLFRTLAGLIYKAPPRAVEHESFKEMFDMRKLMLVVAGLALVGCGPKVSTIEITPKTVTLTKAGEVAKVTAVAKDEAGNPVEGIVLAFTTADEAVAKVDPATGAITAVKSGDVVVKAAFEDKVTAELPVVVSIPASIMVDPAEVKLDGVGLTAKVAAKVIDEKSRPVAVPVIWESGNAAIVTVKDGELTAVAPGVAQVFAVVGNVRAPVAVTVAAPAVETVKLEKAAMDVMVGAAPAKIAVIGLNKDKKPVDGASFTYTVADAKVATVDAAGMVTGLAKGKTKVVVASGEKKAELTVNVKPAAAVKAVPAAAPKAAPKAVPAKR